MKIERILFFVLCLVVFSSSSVSAAQKVAFILGNANYTSNVNNSDTTVGFTDLRTPINDANKMEEVFRELGFDPILVTDANRDEMVSALSRFYKKAKTAEVAVFYYSGHATGIDGANYIVPAKSSILPDGVKSQLVSVRDISTELKKSCPLSFLFIDACRDELVLNQDQDKSKGVVTPSAKPDKNKCRGQKIIYATQPGEPATCGSGELSPFTQVLSKCLFYDEDIESLLLDRIEPELKALTNGKQIPDVHGNMAGIYTFCPGGKKDSIKEQSNENTEISVKITSNAPNAVFEFGSSKFDSGKTLIFKIGGHYVYKVTADGYEPKTGILDITDTTPSELTVNLNKVEKAVANFYCNTTANVYLDDKYIGHTPLTYESTTGSHYLRMTAKGYDSSGKSIDLVAGNNNVSTYLSKDIPTFFKWYGDGCSSLSYHFSPKYQIGINYLYRSEYSRFSYGLFLGASTGLFRGHWGIKEDSYIYVGPTNTTYTVEINGTQITCQETSTRVSDKPIDKYSEDIDPNKEAKEYDANAVILANIGFNPCNGILLEAGFGAGFHQDKYFLPYTSYMTQTVTTNLNTGEVIGEPKIGYDKGSGNKWFKENTRWSPAFRLGAKALIPLDDWDTYSLTLGGGYTFQFMNMKYSSWDASIGFAWNF